MWDIEEEYGHLATPAEAHREYVRNVGAENLDRAYILSPYDVWEKNPFYDGPPVPHPDEEEP